MPNVWWDAHGAFALEREDHRRFLVQSAVVRDIDRRRRLVWLAGVDRLSIPSQGNVVWLVGFVPPGVRRGSCQLDLFGCKISQGSPIAHADEVTASQLAELVVGDK